MTPGYEWLQDRHGWWRLWEVDKSLQLMQWYHQGDGKQRLVRDQDGKHLPRFTSTADGREWLKKQRWGREILGTES